MTLRPRQLLSLALLAISIGWLTLDAPRATMREASFVVVMLGFTIATRTVPVRTAVHGVSLGIGLAAPLMVAVGRLIARMGLDLADSEFGSWAIVPVLEEAVKLVPVFLIAWLYRRKNRMTFNPSDWLLVGSSVGAGFAMVENAQLMRSDPGVWRDMAIQYGPSWLVPGAWGAVGYVGHAAATGLAAAGIGLSRSMRRTAAVRRASLTLGWAALIVPVAWVTLEHALANLRVNTGSDLAVLFGNGRLTPWAFLAVTGLVVWSDYTLARLALRHSRTLRERRAAVKEALTGTRVARHRSLAERLRVAAAEFRLTNAVGWAMLERLVPGGKSR